VKQVTGALFTQILPFFDDRVVGPLWRIRKRPLSRPRPRLTLPDSTGQSATCAIRKSTDRSGDENLRVL
jgi:hypothetical protein